MQIKYFKTVCDNCKAVYTVNLSLTDKSLFCYKCGAEMGLPALDAERIAAVNDAMKAAEKLYMIEPDGGGLVILAKNLGPIVTAGRRSI